MLPRLYFPKKNARNREKVSEERREAPRYTSVSAGRAGLLALLPMTLASALVTLHFTLFIN
jgi:hypothetical protein